MPEYEFSVPEIHFQTYVVSAANPEEAKRRFAEGKGEAVDNGLEYSHIDPSYKGPSTEDLRERKAQN